MQQAQTKLGLALHKTASFEIVYCIFKSYWKAPKALNTGWNEQAENVSGGKLWVFF